MNPTATYKHALIPLAVLALGTTVLAYLQQPFAMQAMMSRMPPEAAARMTEMAGSPFFLATNLIGGVVSLIGVLLWAGGAHLGLAGMYASPQFRRVFVGAAWASLVFLVRDSVRLGTLMYRGIDSVRRPEDMLPGIGMGFLVENHQSLVYQLLELLNVYDLAFIWVFAGLLAASEGVRPPKAIAAVLLPWTLLHAVGIGFSMLFFSR